MRRNKEIKTRVTESKKQRINDYIEETNEFDSVSRMVRVLVTQHIEGESSRVESGADTDEIESVIESQLQPVERKLSELSDRIASLETTAKPSDDKVTNLANQLYDLMIEEMSSEEAIEMYGKSESDLSKEKAAAVKGTASAFADLLSVDRAVAQQALSRAEQMYPDVDFNMNERGERRYYKKK